MSTVVSAFVARKTGLDEDKAWLASITTAVLGTATLTLALVKAVTKLRTNKANKQRAAESLGNNKKQHPVRYIKGNFMFGALVEIITQGGPVEFQKRYMNWEDSEAIWTHFMGPTYFLKGTNMIDQFLKLEQAKMAEARWIGSFLKLFGEKSVLAVNGKEHLAQRKIVLQANNSENISTYLPTAEKAFINLVKEWVELGEQGKAVETQEAMNRFANTVNGRFFLGDALTDADFEFIRANIKPWKDGFAALPIDFPFTTYGKALAARNAIGELVCEEVDRRRREGPPKRWDLLQGYCEGIDPNTGEPYTRDAIKEMFPTILYGALDTTVGTESCIGAIASEQPENFKYAMLKVREDINEKRKSKGLPSYDPATDDSFGLTYGELFSLPYLKATVDEFLRLTGPAPNASRKCIKDMTLTLEDGREFTIPAGANVWIGLATTGFDNRWIQNPKKLDPERYMPPREENKLAGQHGTPYFGFGARLCPGQAFARLQISLLVASLAMQGVAFRYKEPGTVTRITYTPSLEIDGGIWVVATGGAY